MKSKVLQGLILTGSLLLGQQIPTLAAKITPDLGVQVQVSQPLQLGQQAYQRGNYVEAIAQWQQVLQQYQQQKNIDQSALTLSYIALAQQELGQWQTAQNTIQEAFRLTSPHSTAEIQAPLWNSKGQINFVLGQTEVALEAWQQAEKYYQQANDRDGSLGAQFNQIQALQRLGLYRQSRKQLQNMQSQVEKIDDVYLKATMLRSLAIADQLSPDSVTTLPLLENSLALFETLNRADEISQTQLLIGNFFVKIERFDLAEKAYAESYRIAANPQDQFEAALAQLNLFITSEKTDKLAAQVQKLQVLLPSLPLNRNSFYTQVHFAETILAQHERSPDSSLWNKTELAHFLSDLAQKAAQLGDRRSQSYALGTLGKLYEQEQRWSEATTLTTQAIELAQNLGAEEIRYQWHWQLGRIQEAQGQTSKAIYSFQQAVDILKILRKDLVALNPSEQFSFQNSIEPVYRHLISLLLSSDAVTAQTKSNEKETSPTISQAKLRQARDLMEELQVAELENFFREACLDTSTQKIDEIDRRAAVLYPLILRDRLAVILTTPDQVFHYYETKITEKELNSTLDSLLQSLNPIFDDDMRLDLSKKVYDLLIRPAEPYLEKNQIKTIVTVPDGFFRNIPLAALYDGKQYLIEKYSIAFSPGLTLLSSQTSLTSTNISAITAGLTESRQGFVALPGVEKELNIIGDQIPTDRILNESFTKEALTKQIEQIPYPIVHLATHGQFSSYPAQTYIITWNEKLGIDEFASMIRTREQDEVRPIELLVLSACETAAGDRRAALGLAGMAVRSGARSTLATLWSVKDESTAEFMIEFYKELGLAEPVTKAEALRQAQISLIHSKDFSHPFFWAPFILVGNWI